MALTEADIKKLVHQRKAVKGKLYYTDNGNLYRGLSDGNLTELISGENVYLNNNGSLVDELNNINSQLENILTIKETEVTFDDLYTNTKEFTITDNTLPDNTSIIATVAYEAPSTKSLDEIEMDNITVVASKASGGQFRMLVNGTSNTSANVDLLVQPFGGVFQLKTRLGLNNAGSSTAFNDYDDSTPFIIQAKSMVKLRCSYVSTNNTEIMGEYDLILVQD